MKSICETMKTLEVRADSSMMGICALVSLTYVAGRGTHVAGVEETDGVRPALASEAVRLDGDLDPETLEVDHEGEDGDGRDEVHHVRETLAVEGLLERARLVVPREHEMEKRDQRALKLGSTARVDGGGGEGLPHDRLADVGRDEEVDAGPESVALLEELVEQDHDQRRNDELEDEEETHSRAEVGGEAVQAREDVDGCLAKRDDHGED